MAALPKIGPAIDKLYRLRTRRLVAMKKVDEMKAKERAASDHLLQLLKEAGLESGRGKLATITRRIKPIPTVEDWDVLQDFIIKERAFELLQRRPAVGAFRERWENGEVVPGVKRDSILELSLTKAPAR